MKPALMLSVSPSDLATFSVGMHLNLDQAEAAIVTAIDVENGLVHLRRLSWLERAWRWVRARLP